ncbi:MAG: hypothetical protein CV090_16830 [Nitrospira sp. WS238]|nr:hypothetical protein [Nitrospira sp. WS238]
MIIDRIQFLPERSGRSGRSGFSGFSGRSGRSNRSIRSGRFGRSICIMRAFSRPPRPCSPAT